MEKVIARLRQKRKGKKISITKRINMIRRLISENGSRRRLAYLRVELKRVFREAIGAHEELLDKLNLEDGDFEDSWIEDLGIEVDDCCAYVEEHIESRNAEEPSLSGDAFEDRFDVSASEFQDNRRFSDSLLQHRSTTQEAVGLPDATFGVSTSFGNLQISQHPLISNIGQTAQLGEQSRRYSNPLAMEPILQVSTADVLRPHYTGDLWHIDPMSTLHHTQVGKKHVESQKQPKGIVTNSLFSEFNPFSKTVAFTDYNQTNSIRKIIDGQGMNTSRSSAQTLINSTHPWLDGIFMATPSTFQSTSSHPDTTIVNSINTPHMAVSAGFALPTSASDTNYRMDNRMQDQLIGAEGVQHNIPDPEVVTLERLQLPSFDGDKYKYEEWKDIFQTCIDSRPGNEKWKMLRLKSCLTGDAKSIIHGLDNSFMAYQTALDRLEKEYGGRRRILARHLNDVKEARQITSPGSHRELRKFVTLLDAVIISLTNNGRTEELGDGMLYHVAKTKIPKSLLIQFKRWITEKQKEDNLINLRDWLLDEVRIMVETQEDLEGFKPKKDGFIHHSSNENDRCILCGSNHELETCGKLKEMGVEGRRETLQRLKLCFRCLGKGHRSYMCRSTKCCAAANCGGKHHTLLHETTRSPTTTNSINMGGKTSLRTVPVVISNGNKRFKIMAVLDDCSTATYLSEDLASALQLEGELAPMEVSVIGSGKQTFDSMEVEFKLCSVDGKFQNNVRANTIKEVTGKIHTVNWKKERSRWSHLTNIPFPNLPKNTRVKLLIGLDISEVHQSLKEVVGKPKEPIARRTPLGWTCMGSVSNEKSTFAIRGAHSFLVHTNSWKLGGLDDQLKRFWDLESLGLLPRSDTPVLTPDEKYAINITNKTRTKEMDRYQVGIPWKSGEPNMKNNFPLAYSRLLSLEASLKRKPELRKEYAKVIQDYSKKGYIEEVPYHQRQEHEWFLPHFPVVREDKATSKVRVVFDAAAKSGGKCLNDAIHTGPKLLQDLFRVLIRFRSRKFAIVGDIAEMFLQIGLHREDRKYHRFLWRERTNQEVQVFEFARLTFGNKASPFLAQDVLQHHADVNIEKYPLATDTIQNATYMDDVSDSRDTIEETIELRRQLSALLSSAGFHIRKWCSNSSEVLHDIPEKDCAKNVSLEDGIVPRMKTLGITWETREDYFSFEINKSEAVMTKRGVLQKVASIFDPLQFLAPFVIRAKGMLQHAWTLGLSWDEKLSGRIKEEWELWFKELGTVSEIKVPRYLGFTKHRTSTLHTFVDASTLAYAAVTYVRTEDGYGNVNLVMVAAKSRVAPLKTLSIPRLELLAAVIGLRLAESIRSCYGIIVNESTFWSDSRNVLYWVHGQSKRYKPFVAHRVGEIHEHSSPQQWRHIPTDMNPADLATRGLKSSDQGEWNKWFTGPSFLKESLQRWPKHKVVKPETAEMEIKKDKQTLMTVSTDDKWLSSEDFSSWRRLKRLTAWCFRFLVNTRMKCRSIDNTLRVDELQMTEAHWIKVAQEDNYSHEIELLKQQKQIPKSSKLIRLQPTVDEVGILRVGGRLKLATRISRDAREPIILPRKHHITRLIIYHEHEMLHHKGGVNHLLSQLSQTFWILRAREAIKEVIYNCARCLRNNATVKPQIMAPLPEIRTNVPLRAFAHSGLDYAGPFMTRQGRGKAQAKRYLCLFTCLASRAVHLEMAWSLDTDSFLEALSRMVARRGRPRKLISDNGTNFTSAEAELRELVANLNQNKITSKTAELNIDWKFNPPGAPHFGGIFESMIKTAKRAITAILGNAMIKDEELLTAFTISEGLINSRPLTYQSADPKDELPLTPNHFLFGQAGAEVVSDVDYKEYNPNRRWYYTQQLINGIWKRWMREILPTLNPRNKWNTIQDDLKVDDIVICIDANTPRGKWPMGRVIERKVGIDGHVRVVTIKIGDKTAIRPISRLIRIQTNRKRHCEKP